MSTDQSGEKEGGEYLMIQVCYACQEELLDNKKMNLDARRIIVPLLFAS